MKLPEILWFWSCVGISYKLLFYFSGGLITICATIACMSESFQTKFLWTYGLLCLYCLYKVRISHYILSQERNKMNWLLVEFKVEPIWKPSENHSDQCFQAFIIFNACIQRPEVTTLKVEWSYVVHNPVATKKITFALVFIVLVLNVKLFLATGFEFVYAVTAFYFIYLKLRHSEQATQFEKKCPTCFDVILSKCQNKWEFF